MSFRVFARPVFAATCAVALVACSRDKAPHAPPPAPVTVTKAAAKDMPILLTAVGSVEPINSVSVKSLIDGQILESLVKDGDDVKQNQLLFRIDPRPAEAALKQSEAAQAKDRGDARAGALAGQALCRDRRQGLHLGRPDGAVPHERRRGAAAVKVDQANVVAAKVTLGYTEIHSPIAGRIGRILIQPGNLVKANDTNALVVINQIEPIYVNFALSGAQLGPVLVGAACLAAGRGGERDRRAEDDRRQGRVRRQRGRHDDRHGEGPRDVRQFRASALAGPARQHQPDARRGQECGRRARSRRAERTGRHLRVRREARSARRAAQGRASSA